jgi:hypothetical protein
MFKWIKYAAIILQSVIQQKTVVNFFGGTYVVAKNIVRRIR